MANYYVMKQKQMLGSVNAETHYDALKKAFPQASNVVEVTNPAQADIAVKGPRVTKFFKVATSNVNKSQTAGVVYKVGIYFDTDDTEVMDQDIGIFTTKEKADKAVQYAKQLALKEEFDFPYVVAANPIKLDYFDWVEQKQF